jgi:hypothetical protein
MTISFSVRVSVPPHILIRQIENESVLLNLQNERYFGLDEVSGHDVPVFRRATYFTRHL